MKILVIADYESPYLWDYFEKSKLEGIDLILSAGDLNSAYLEFLATCTPIPIMYVHGNHDHSYDSKPPLGCQCIDDDVVEFKGLRILGLGGSMCYNYGKYQYSEKQMRARIKKLRMKLWRKGGVDIILTHAPIRGFHDQEDLPHLGFECFGSLVEKYHPKYFIHGHVHKNYSRDFKREDLYKDTIVVNGYERYILEIPDSYFEKEQKVSNSAEEMEVQEVVIEAGEQQESLEEEMKINSFVKVGITK